jgi:acyl carrier protein
MLVALRHFVGGYMEDRVMLIIAEQLGLPQTDIDESKRFIDDLGADSLDIVELVMTMEDEFQASIPDDDALNIETVGDVIRFLKQHAAAQ